jgi:transcriptional regulator with PAS, ATPase and Fis domain
MVDVSLLLKRSEVLQALLAGTDEGIVIADANARVVYSNAAARRLFEVPDEQVIEHLGDIGGVNLRLAIVRGLIALGFQDPTSRVPEGVVEVERWFALPSGTRRCLRMRTCAVHAAHDGARHQIVLLRDVTESKKLLSDGDGAAAEFVTRDARMLEALRQLAQVAPTDACVLLQGESGTGKNVLARMLHQASRRAARALVEVNCAAIPTELLETEFFGHVRGAFTGAAADRIGRFKAADGGTLFLDEIGEVPLHLQAKFLKVVQDRAFEPVGSSRTQQVDVRIVSASNRNLKQAVDARQFRADLYYRLSVFTMHVPPLRERKADIALLIDRRLSALFARGYPRAQLAPEALRLLIDYPWPGNVRELENAVEHALICASDGVIVPASLPSDIRAWQTAGAAGAVAAQPNAAATEAQARGQIMFALKQCGGNRLAAAKMLGIDRTTLWRRMRRLGLA